MPPQRNQIFGIDFSGAKQPGQKIWITEARITGQNLDISASKSAIDWFGISSNAKRQQVYNNIRDFVKANKQAVFGFDFPFSIPEEFLQHISSWTDYIDAFQHSLGNLNADKFRKRRVGEAESQLSGTNYRLRETDFRYGGQCPYNHQICYQTYHGQRDILHPLIQADEARALPMQSPSSGRPILVEVYPAGTMARLGLYRQGYKEHPDAETRRMQNIDGLRANGVNIGQNIERSAKKNDDAHDSIVAAVATYRARKAGFPDQGIGAAIEGQIFV